MRSSREESTRGTSEWVRGIVVGLAVGLATASAAQEQTAATQTSTATQQPTVAKAEEQPNGGMGDGIKVHGHWTIDIKNPDGTLVAHHEFENALVSDGAALLARLLGRRASVGSWYVRVPSNPPCYTNNSNCLIDEPGSLFVGGSKNLIVDVPTAGPNAGKLVLSGSTTAPRAIEIVLVDTSTDACTAGNCVASSLAFTQKNLVATPIPVAEGQIVQVTVVISFS